MDKPTPFARYFYTALMQTAWISIYTRDACDGEWEAESAEGGLVGEQG